MLVWAATGVGVAGATAEGHADEVVLGVVVCVLEGAVGCGVLVGYGLYLGGRYAVVGGCAAA